MYTIHAEVSILPIGTGSTSMSEYIAKAIETLDKVEGLKYHVTPMGTMLETESLDKLFEGTKAIINTLSEIGVKRSQTLLKIDVRHDKKTSLEDMINSLKKYSHQSKDGKYDSTKTE